MMSKRRADLSSCLLNFYKYHINERKAFRIWLPYTLCLKGPPHKYEIEVIDISNGGERIQYRVHRSFRKNRNFRQKSKLWLKIEILVKNRNFDAKSKFWSKIEILMQNLNFGQKSKFWCKIEILVKNLNFDAKSKFWCKIEILVKNRNFGKQ